MKARTTSELYDRQHAVAFYEDRYQHGYLDEWPIEKKQRIVDVLLDLHLPSTGEALDFGCGNGVLTELVRQTLPAWKISGTDISSVAVANARQRYPDCTFYEADNPELALKKFDFVFSNHVFEHVFNLSDVFRQMCGFLKPRSSMLHFLPCGNAGSYEHAICLLRKDGIDATLENRFFFEDEGHVRRLTTEQFSDLAHRERFELNREYYFNQYYGAIEWITNSHPRLVLTFSDVSCGIDRAAKKKLRKEQLFLLFLTILRLPSQILEKVAKTREKKLKHVLLQLAAWPFSLFSNPIDRYWKRKAREEWETQKTSRSGSEMGLYFTRG